MSLIARREMSANAPRARETLGKDVLGDFEFPFTTKDFKYLSQRVYDHAGIVLGQNKINMVYSRLAPRLRALGLAAFSEYCDLLRDAPDDAEFGVFINAITTNLTKFFRESHHFDHLKEVYCRELVAREQRTGQRRLRVWSAGCSSGEEPYSIAMTLSEGIPDLARWDAKLLATDLDTNMVARAAAGIYRTDGLGEMPTVYKTKYISHGRDQDTVIVSERLRVMIAFKQLNLLHAWPMKGPFDAIFCRNVMIYFDNATKNELVRRFVDLLCPGGFLYIGHSETLLDHPPNLALKGRTIYQKVAR